MCQEVLCEKIGAENLPEFLGGTCPDSGVPIYDPSALPPCEEEGSDDEFEDCESGDD